MPNGLKRLGTLRLADDLPAPRDQCQAPILDRQHRIHQCPNQAKVGKRYCGTHRFYGLPRTAWDSSKDAAIR